MTSELPQDDPPPITGGGERKKCEFKYPDGRQCAARPLSGSDFCFFHDPREEIAQKRLEGRRMGGKRKVWKGLGNDKYRNVKDFKSLNELLNDAANAVMCGRMDARIGNCLASISNAMYRIIEARDIEGRLDEIERRMEEKEKHNSKSH